jgi:hypothetical protein
MHIGRGGAGGSVGGLRVREILWEKKTKKGLYHKQTVLYLWMFSSICTHTVNTPENNNCGYTPLHFSVRPWLSPHWLPVLCYVRIKDGDERCTLPKKEGMTYGTGIQ